MQQLVELKRLGDEVGGASPDRVDGILHRAVAGDDDADDLGIAQQRGLEHARAVQAGQTEVGDDDVERKFCQLLDSLLTGIGLLHLKAVLGQAFRQRLAQRRLVFDKKEMFFGFRHLAAASGF